MKPRFPFVRVFRNARDTAIGLGFLFTLSVASVGAAVTTSGTTNISGTTAFVGSGTVTPGFLTVDGGSILAKNRVHIGDTAGSTGTATISGAGSSIIASEFYSTGLNGTGSLTISNGGSATAQGAMQIATNFGSTGTVTVSGAGSSFNATGATPWIDVGLRGNGALSVSSGAIVNSIGGFIASLGGSANATFTGVGSAWNNSGSLSVGGVGNGTLLVSDGAVVYSGTLSGSSSIAREIGSTSTATVTGVGTTWNNSGGLSVGVFGNGTLLVSDGAVVYSGTLSGSSSVGRERGSTSTATVQNGAIWDARGETLHIGVRGDGTLNILNGGIVKSGDIDDGSSIGLEAPGRGIVNVSGPTSVWDASANSLRVGHSGSGDLNISNGGSVTSLTGQIGRELGSEGDVTIQGTGSVWNVLTTLEVGRHGAGELNLLHGGRINVQSGTGTVALASSADGFGLLNIGGAFDGSAAAGGIVNAASITIGPGFGAIQLHTTATSASPYYLTRDGTSTGTAVNIGINEPSLLINSGGYNVLQGTTNTFGGTLINGGTLVIGSGGSFRNDLSASSGQTFSDPESSLVWNPGAIKNSGTLVVAAGASVTGTGSFTQVSGAVTAVQGSFAQGTLNVDGGVFVSSGPVAIAGNANNSGILALNGSAAVFSVGGTYTQSGPAASAIMVGNASFLSSNINVTNGVFGGNGIVTGNVVVSGGTMQVGASPDALAIHGNYFQTGGKLLFDIGSDGVGGFLTSTLVFDTGKLFSLTNTEIDFNFLNGTDFAGFYGLGLFNLNTFFKLSDGALFSSAYNIDSIIQQNTFTFNQPGFAITKIDPRTGAFVVAASTVPDSGSTLVLLFLSLIATIAIHRRR